MTRSINIIVNPHYSNFPTQSKVHYLRIHQVEPWSKPEGLTPWVERHESNNRAQWWCKIQIWFVQVSDASRSIHLYIPFQFLRKIGKVGEQKHGNTLNHCKLTGTVAAVSVSFQVEVSALTLLPSVHFSNSRQNVFFHKPFFRPPRLRALCSRTVRPPLATALNQRSPIKDRRAYN